MAAHVMRGLDVRPLALALLLGGPWASAAAGQTLDQVDDYLRDGRLQEARSALLVWESATPDPSRADRQRGLWLRGLLTLDPDEASSSYARLLVEYPGGPYTDRALLRLAQAADLRGDPDEAAIHYAQLARDHPTSPLQARAERWLRDHPEVLGDAGGAGTAGSGVESSTGTASAEPPRPPGRVAEGSSGGSPPRSDGASGILTGYTVQLGAFSDPRWAEDLASQLQAAGFQPRVVRIRDDALVRVRIGRYETRAEAVVARDRVRAAGFEASLSTDARREQGVG
jgi:cell division septation protein DedD